MTSKYGVPSLITLSDGRRIQNPQYTELYNRAHGKKPFQPSKYGVPSSINGVPNPEYTKVRDVALGHAPFKPSPFGPKKITLPDGTKKHNEASQINYRRSKGVKPFQPSIYGMPSRIRDENGKSIKNPEYNEERRLVLEYGITIAGKKALWEAQNHLCGLCGHEMLYEEAYVDHNHQTHEVRSLVHNHCNRVIGWFNEDPEIFEAIARALRTNPKYNVSKLEELIG